MYKNERKRAIVYSNMHDKKKRADANSASNDNPIINLDDEIIIGLTKFPVQKNTHKKKKISKKLNNNGKKDDNISSNSNEIKRKKVQSNKHEENFKKTSNNKNIKYNEYDQIEVEVTTNNNKRTSTKTTINTGTTKKSNLTKEQKIKQQKRKIIRKLTTFAFFLVLIIGSITFFMLSPIFNIKTIEVINNNNIASDQIISASKITLDENMFKISIKEIQNNILSNNYIESVKVKRKPFNKIQIDVKERIATLMLEYGNSYVYINNQGYILEISTTKLQAPIIKGYTTSLEEIKPGNRLNKEDLVRLEKVLNIMETAGSNDIDKLITQIDIHDEKNYKLIFDTEGKIVYLGQCLDLSTQMLFVKKMLEKEEGIQGEFFVNMDLNTGDPVFREKV